MRKFLALTFYNWAIGLAGSKDDLLQLQRLDNFKYLVREGELREQIQRGKPHGKRTTKQPKAKATKA